MINFNGKILDDDSLFLNQTNRGLKYGDSIFETLRAVNSSIFFLEDHYFRLMASMRILRMEIPHNFTMEFIQNEILQLIKANSLENKSARVRVTVFREAGGLYLPLTNDIAYIIEVKPLESPFYLINDEPYEVELYKDHYVHSGLLSTLKTGNRIINVTGSIFAKENNYDNCLLLNEAKHVVEALNANIFLVNEEKLVTPPLSDGCINGIVRRKLIEVINKTQNYTIEERSVSPFELQKADEIFLTNVVMGIRPVTKYRKKSFTNEVGNDLLKKLNVLARLI